MLWEVVIRSAPTEVDREAERVLQAARQFGAASIQQVSSARSFLIEGDLAEAKIQAAAGGLLVDPVTEVFEIRQVPAEAPEVATSATGPRLTVLLKPGVTDNVAESARRAFQAFGVNADAVATCREYVFGGETQPDDLSRFARRFLYNEAIERVIPGELHLETLHVGTGYEFQLQHVPLLAADDEELQKISRQGQLSLSLPEMHTIQAHFREQNREPTDAELETIAQTWSEHCSHKTLAGRIRYRDENGERQFDNMLKETIFAATQQLRREAGDDDWCVSVFKDNAGIVTFDDEEHVCFKVETHNHPSAIEPYGGANTGLGGVIRDPMGTGLGARPVCNTDVFCFAPPTTPADELPPGVLHPQVVMSGVVAGVRDYGNRMGIPTVNGAVYFDPRYLGNPLVYCGNVAMIPVDRCEKQVDPGTHIVAIGGRTGRDGIHGATFSSAELTDASEVISGGAVQIGNAVMEKMVLDALIEARDRGLYTAITDCGAGGFSSAVGEMGADCGAEVRLDLAPLKYQGLSYTEIWISEAQERMVLAVPPESWEEFHAVCAREGVEATIIGTFTGTGRLVLKYEDTVVADLSMDFLHEGRPPVVRDAVFTPPAPSSLVPHADADCEDDLLRILGSLNVCSKEWIIRQYDHEVQAGSVVKPLVGVTADGPSDAAVVRPRLSSRRGLAVSNGMNPHYGDIDPYWMAASAIDEAVRNCVAVGADPARIAILDNFCWGNTDKPETLGSLVRASLGCYDTAVAFTTPFISGKDSLYNEFSFDTPTGERRTVAIPGSLLISALGQLDDVGSAVTMDLKQPGNVLFLVGRTTDEFGGSHWALVNGQTGGTVPRVDLPYAPTIFGKVHAAIQAGLVRSCHDLSEGGLAVASAEMAFAGGYGATLNLSAAQSHADVANDVSLLFSESNTRFLLEVPDGDAGKLESLFAGLPLARIGTVVEEPTLTVSGSDDRPLVDLPLDALKSAWQSPLQWD